MKSARKKTVHTGDKKERCGEENRGRENMSILQELEKRILFCDGGMGSLLQQAGLKPGELPGVWNMTHPEVLVQLRQVHRSGANSCWAEKQQDAPTARSRWPTT